MAAIDAIGIDLGGTKIEAVFARGIKIIDRKRIATPSDSYEATLNAIVGLVNALSEDPVPVGIGTPGVYLAATQRMSNCNSTWLNGRPLLSDLESQLGPRVHLANDADCFALSEAASGAGKSWRTLFGVILGTGVGGGLVIDGHLHQGANGIAGEWGHMALPNFQQDSLHNDALSELEVSFQHRRCYCGRSNCVEKFLSGPALQASHEELWSKVAVPEDIGKQVTPECQQTMALYFRMLARSLAQVINVVDPVGIVFGGGLSQLPNLVTEMAKVLPEYVFSESLNTQLAIAEHGDASGVRGALNLAQQSL